MKEDNYSVRDINGRPIDTGTPFIIGILRNMCYLLPFPSVCSFTFLIRFRLRTVHPDRLKSGNSNDTFRLGIYYHQFTSCGCFNSF